MRSIEFLLRRQRSDGSWRDFLLKPGRSDAWVTAYVGLRLIRFAHGPQRAGVNRAVAAAVRFVETARDPRGGWGYNRSCAPDADSTAQAILFLRAAGSTPALRDYAALAAFQLRDGAFRTYQPGDARGGWCRGHPDVTAVALRALAGVLAPNHVILRRGYRKLAAYLTRRDPTASYWWPSPFYLARELLVLSQQVGGAPAFEVPDPVLVPEASCFERALALETALRRGDQNRRSIGRAARALVALALPDGSWPSAPMLRVVKPASRRVGDRYCSASPVVADDERLFTTATVAAALAFAQSRTRRSSPKGKEVVPDGFRHVS